MNPIPLSTRARPQSLDDFFGQEHLLGASGPLYQALKAGKLHSMIFWGPPGTGKTTLAHIIAQHFQADFHALSAVLAGVKDIRDVAAQAERSEKPTLLFLDEIHRFNKSQQDALLPHVESGLITLIGATTENPSFALNNALLSRARVYILKSLEPATIEAMLARALRYVDSPKPITPEALKAMASAADGDARRALNSLEMALDLTPDDGEVTEATVAHVIKNTLLRFDKGGDAWYDQISALHKSVRGSDPDAALYWMARMLVAGCDPMYLARRLVRMSNEDIGNADPRAFDLAMNAWQAMERLGSPEGELALAQTVVYLACAPKSNAVYKAYGAATEAAQKYGSLPVPPHLCNAPTALLKSIGHGKDYRYAHDAPNAYVPNEQYFPDKMPKQRFYEPVPRGMEIQIKEKLASLRALDETNT
ncbi:MAG: replication-associated recombination protein A [Gammaproteobacteria bacterium]